MATPSLRSSSDSPIQVPLDIEIQIWEQLDLKGLIKCCCVCKRWRQTITALNGVISTPRLALLSLYHDTIFSPTFLSNRELLLPYLKQDFDRDVYLEGLSARISQGGDGQGHGSIPEEFAMWIREWPQMACDLYWPGLDHSRMKMPKPGTCELGRAVIEKLSVATGSSSASSSSEDVLSSSMNRAESAPLWVPLECLKVWSIGNGTETVIALVVSNRGHPVGKRASGSEGTHGSVVIEGFGGARGYTFSCWTDFLWHNLNL
jgi:hypothetical protein